MKRNFSEVRETDSSGVVAKQYKGITGKSVCDLPVYGCFKNISSTEKRLIFF